MAARVPDKLKTADISRFAQRAAQVEPHKPAIAYWAYYYIVQQILERNLHTADDACKEYTTNLMDKLEQMKSQYPTDDAISDDMAGQAFVEQFGMEIFQRADNAVLANKATRTTGDNFWTAATFLDLLHIWGDPAPDIARKTKYAKIEAARIFKAIKAGEDPNLSNPAPKPASDEASVPLDPNDPDVQRLDSAAAAQSSAADVSEELPRGQPSPLSKEFQATPPQTAAREPLWPPPRPSVVEVPDEHDRLQQTLARQSSLNESLHPSRAPSVPRPPPPEPASANASASASPMPQPSDESHPFMASTEPSPRKDSVGGGYFPETQASAPSSGPSRDLSASNQAFSPGQGWAPTHGQPTSPENAQAFYRNSPAQSPPVPPSVASLPHAPTMQQASGWSPPPPPTAPVQQPPATTYHHQQQLPPPQPQPLAPQAPVSIPPSAAAQTYLTDDVAMTQAQKHAKWAISALNFEDVPTAVKELREALRSLGTS